MKHYQELAKLKTFTLEKAASIIGNPVSAPNVLNRMIKEKSIHRIRQNLYTCVDFATGEDCANRFNIASNITPNSFISAHTAFEFYGFYNQVYYDVQVFSEQRFKEFEYDYYSYKQFLSKSDAQVNVIQGVRVASIERTIVDSINLLGKVMDAEELVKCIELVHSINLQKILEMLSIYNKEVLYRKVGYVLSFFKQEFDIPKSFFEECKSKGNLSNKGSLVQNDKTSEVFIPEWGIYAYKNLRKLSYKGGEEDV